MAIIIIFQVWVLVNVWHLKGGGCICVVCSMWWEGCSYMLIILQPFFINVCSSMVSTNFKLIEIVTFCLHCWNGCWIMIKVYGVLKVANLFEEVFSTIQQIYHVCGLGTKIRWVWYQKILEPYRIIYILKIMWKTKSNYFVNIHIPIVCIVPCFSIIFLKSLTLTHLLVFTS